MQRSGVIKVGVVALMAFAAASARSQNLRFTGRVTSDSAMPLVAAQVFLLGIGVGGVTDVEGRYAFELPAERVHGQSAKLTARLIGFKSISVDVILGGARIEHDFALSANRYVCCFDPVTPQPTYATTTASILDENAKISRAAGFGELRRSHRRGEREIRIWMWGTGTFELYRIVERSGKFSGARVRYRTWPNEQLRSSQLRFDTQPLGRGCARVSTRGLILTCAMKIPADADWKQPWSELEAAGVWELPSSETMEQPIVVEDRAGSIVTVELWDGEAYRAWSYLMSYQIGGGRVPDGEEQSYAIWRVTRGINLLSPQ
jgi:hypothetical protein